MEEQINLIYKELLKLNLISPPNNPSAIWKLLKSNYPYRTVEFDLESIETEVSYENIFDKYALCFSDEYDIDDFATSSFLNRESDHAGLKTNIFDQDLSGEWEQTSDWVSENFFSFIKTQVEPLLAGRFVEYINEDQFYRAVYVKKDNADILDNLLRSYEEAMNNI